MDGAALRAIAERFTLGLLVWREARGESYECRVAVACSVMNRVERPSWWGRDVLSVAYRRWQYSSLTDPKDKQLTTWPSSTDGRWWDCLQIACDALEGKLQNPVPGADSYYDDSIPPPKWATPAKLVRSIGRISFYDLDRDEMTVA